jgi:hypothetical protein
MTKRFFLRTRQRCGFFSDPGVKVTFKQKYKMMGSPENVFREVWRML